MNKGIKLSKGKWLFFLGADDIFYNNDVLDKVFNKTIESDYSLIAGKVLYNSNNSQFIYSKNQSEKSASWSSMIWVRNALHHQGTFYKKTLFDNVKYDLKYPILADYALNLSLYNAKEKCKILDDIIASCSGNGLSKTGNWSIYKEEISLKTNQSSKLFLPFFFIIASIKYLLGKSNK